MVNAGASIEAFLRLDATDFKSGLQSVSTSVTKFKESMLDVGKQSGTLTTGVNQVSEALQHLTEQFVKLGNIDNTTISKFKNIATALQNIATAAQRMSVDAERGAVGIEALGQVMKIFDAGVSSAEVHLKLTNAELAKLGATSNSAKSSVSSINTSFNSVKRNLQEMQTGLYRYGTVMSDTEAKTIHQTQLMTQEYRRARQELFAFANGGVEAFNKILTTQQRYQQSLANMRNSASSTSQALMRLARAWNSEEAEILRTIQATTQYSAGATDVRRSTETLTSIIQKNTEAMRVNGEAKLRAMGYTGQINGANQREYASTQMNANAQRQLAGAYNQSSSSASRNSSAVNQSASSMNRASTSAKGLGRALSSLRSIGTLVGSMLVYNFAHNLITATRETVNAKSEMEGYFKMLHFSSGQINSFNSALDRTVSQFQRVNKYSLGETISSIGVEFNLTTKEMEKAMTVTSMITSEYLRAGRNANEASLAVKDVLQGQFQRLSRETGVKGEQLKEAGWNGDPTDTMSLLEALEKVANDRNWNVFAEKANSLNDIVTILQNRFGEWSADMVNVVQPSIVNAFNSIMSFGQSLAGVLSNMWKWLNTDGWGQTAVKIGALVASIYTLTTAFTMYRTSASLLELRNAGVLKSIYALITGTKLEEVANMGARNSIFAKILGLDAELVANEGLVAAINAKTASTTANTVATTANTTSQYSGITAVIGKYTATLTDNEITGLNTIANEANTVSKIGNTGATIGFTEALGAMIAGEALSTDATLTLSGALGVLSGAFLTSPVGWFALAIAGLAASFYVLTGGLDSTWNSMKNFNQMTENVDATIKPYNDRVDRLTKKLEEAKQKYGENSQEVQNLQSKLNSAKEAQQSFNDALNQGVNAKNGLSDALDELNPRLDEYVRNVIKANGGTDEDADKTQQLLDDLAIGTNRYYHAAQVANHQMGIAGEELDSYGGKLKDARIEGDSFNGMLANYGNLQKELITNSATHNTTDDWWESITSGFNAGFAQKQIDWADWQTQIIKSGNEGGFVNAFAKVGGDIYNGIFGSNGIGKFFNTNWLTDGLSTAFNNVNLGDIFNFKGTIDWIKLFGEGLFGDIWKDINFSQIFNDLLTKVQEARDSFFKNLFGNGEDAGNGNGLQKIDVGKILGWLFGSIDLNGISEWLNNNLVKPITDWFNNFISDPLGTLGIDTGGFSIGELFNTLLGYEVDGLTMMWDWLNNNLIMPLQQAWMQFTADPIGYLGGLVFDFANFINTLFNTGSDGFSMWQWATDNIITPLSNAITTGIANIPIVGDIAQMLGLIPQQDPNAQDKGTQLARAFGNAITNMIGQIPIVGDILRMLGLIPQTNPTANQNGHGVGDNIKQGVKNGITGVVDIVTGEIGRVVSAVAQKAGEAFQAAYDVGAKIVEGIKSAMHINSPGILATDIIPTEFGVNIPNAITSNADMAYSSAQYYGQQMVDGVSSVSTTGVGLGNMVGEYESDAQTIATSSQLMGTETTLAFNNMQMAVNSTTNSMVGNVNSSYTSMQQKQTTSLNSMKQNNLQAYNDMYLKSNQSLLQMRTSTENVTNQMVHAWSHMKNQIVATANRLKAESTSHFNQLSNTIGSFYRKIQNPSSWGSAGGGSRMNVRGARHPTTGKNFTNSIKTRTSNGHYAGGDVGSYPTLSKNKTMTIRQLKNMICPNGSCDLFDGYDLSQTVNVSDFLSKIGGEHGFGSWSSWDRTHYNYIKQKSDQWSMKSPTINLKGGIPTNANFKVGDFESGAPKISFSEFESMARALFTPSSGGLPYKLYFDSSWKGSWLGAFQAGACNCWDGANGLIAFANTCGFGGHIAHGSWNGIPHVWAVINGRKMDTTGMQQRGTWTPSASAGGLPSKSYAGGDTGKTVNVTVDMSNSTIYGVEDLDERIEEGVKKGMQQEFNDSFAVTL